MTQQELARPTATIDRAWAILFARLVLGLIFFMAGVMKVFQLGPLNHARKYFLPFADTFLPVWSLWAMGVVIPFVELIAGALVILGLRVREALVALGFVLAVVTFGHLLHEGWEQKKKFASGVSNERVDHLYTTARNAGAMGGKLAGAGGGGFMMIYCEEGRQDAVTRAMEAEGLRRMDYTFDNGGARVLLNTGLRLVGAEIGQAGDTRPPMGDNGQTTKADPVTDETPIGDKAA